MGASTKQNASAMRAAPYYLCKDPTRTEKNGWGRELDCRRNALLATQWMEWYEMKRNGPKQAGNETAVATAAY